MFEGPPKVERKEKNEDIIFVDAEFEMPDEFKNDPIKYFKSEGENIKEGDTKIDEDGRVREDPEAVKVLPNWKTKNNDYKVIGKLVNTEKGQIKKSGNPIHEFSVLSRIHELGLPGARPIARAEHNGEHLLIMEKLKGISLENKNKLVEKLKEEYKFVDSDILKLESQAKKLMGELEERFTEAGIIRKWKLSDMVVEIDFENKIITKMTPVDWERTTIIEKDNEEQ